MPKTKALLDLRVTAAAHDIIKKQVKESLKRLKQPSPLEGEALHELRVSLRRLRSYLSVFRLYLPESCKKDRKKLAYLANLSNEARDLEVFGEYLNQWLEQANLDKEEKNGIVILLDSIDKIKDHKLAEDFSAMVKHVLEGITHKVKDKKSKYSEELYLHEFAATVLQAYGKELEFYLSEMSGSEEAIHKARICAKRLRYFLESLDDASGAKAIGLLKDTQEHLGRLHDYLAMLAYTKTVLLQTAQRWLEDKCQNPGETNLKTLPLPVTALYKVLQLIQKQYQQDLERFDEASKQFLLDSLEETSTNLLTLS